MPIKSSGPRRAEISEAQPPKTRLLPPCRAQTVVRPERLAQHQPLGTQSGRPAESRVPGLLARWPAARGGNSSRGGEPVTCAFGLPTSLHCLKTSDKFSSSSAGRRSLRVCPAAGISPPSPRTLGSRSSSGRHLPLLGAILGLCFKRKVKSCCRKL